MVEGEMVEEESGDDSDEEEEELEMDAEEGEEEGEELQKPMGIGSQGTESSPIVIGDSDSEGNSDEEESEEGEEEVEEEEDEDFIKYEVSNENVSLICRFTACWIVSNVSPPCVHSCMVMIRRRWSHVTKLLNHMIQYPPFQTKSQSLAWVCLRMKLVWTSLPLISLYHLDLPHFPGAYVHVCVISGYVAG